jgi:WhiB family redox-sensing transcriptional regulator
MRTARIRIRETDNTNWQVRAACGPDDAELFFPISYVDPACLPKVEEAKSICATCPVRQFCLDDALDEEKRTKAESRNGIRGGLTPEERANHVGVGRSRRSYRRAA